MNGSPADARSGERTTRPPGRFALAVASALVLGAGGLAAGGVVLLLASLVVVAVVDDVSLPVSLGVGLVASQAGIALVALGYLRYRPRIADAIDGLVSWSPSREGPAVGASVPGLRDLGIVLAGWIAAFVGALLGAQVVGYVLTRVVEQEPGANPTTEVGFEQPELLLALIPVMFLIVGPAEELLFRGVVQGRLREVFGRWPAILLASAIFAGLHYFVLTGGQPTANAVAVSVLLVPALVFGAAYEYTENLVVPALIHALYNSTLLVVLYAAFEYTDAFEQGGEAVLAALC